uniref:Uncharacterized protein n=1 Tax=Lepeophtheirus salmonis TaxID=72036 RepID=A0A0K2VCQ3_LEPSM
MKKIHPRTVFPYYYFFCQLSFFITKMTSLLISHSHNANSHTHAKND